MGHKLEHNEIFIPIFSSLGLHFSVLVFIGKKINLKLKMGTKINNALIGLYVD